MKELWKREEFIVIYIKLEGDGMCTAKNDRVE